MTTLQVLPYHAFVNTPPLTNSHHTNGYDLIRLILASFVLYSHGYAIADFGETHFMSATHARTPLGTIAVCGFFGLSGLLVTASFNRSPNAWNYFKKRIARIFPGFWVCLLVTAFIFAPAIFFIRTGSLNNFPFIGENSSFSYIFANFFLEIDQWSIGSVLESMPYSKSLNGSLWTLFPEFLCYLVTFFLGSMGWYQNKRFLIVGCYMVLYATFICLILETDATEQISFGLITFSMYLSYLTGLLFCIFESALSSVKLLAAFTVVTNILLLALGGFPIAAPLLIPLMVLTVGKCFTFPLKNDYSYGIYIYGFVVQQLLACFALTRSHPFLFISLSLFFSILFGIASWHLVERPALTLVRTRRARLSIKGDATHLS